MFGSRAMCRSSAASLPSPNRAMLTLAIVNTKNPVENSIHALKSELQQHRLLFNLGGSSAQTRSSSPSSKHDGGAGAATRRRGASAPPPQPAPSKFVRPQLNRPSLGAAAAMTAPNDAHTICVREHAVC